MTTPVNTGFTLNPKLYDFLKWVALTVLPALVVLVAGFGTLMSWEAATPISGGIALFDTFLGALLGQSSKNNAQQQLLGDLVFGTDQDGNAYVKRIAVDQANPVFQDGGKVTLQVKRELEPPPG